METPWGRAAAVTGVPYQDSDRPIMLASLLPESLQGASHPAFLHHDTNKKPRRVQTVLVYRPPRLTCDQRE